MQTPPSWDPSFSVGNELMDSQHRRLVSICAKLAGLLEEHGPDAAREFHMVLDDLSDYARIHFAAEETLLKDCNFPKLDSHMSEHSDCLEQLSEFLLAATKGVIAKEQLYHFLTNWWTNHVRNSDMQYAGQLRTSR